MKRDNEEAAAGPGKTRSIRPALAGLSLSMLMSSLGTSIANVALPTLSQVFGASFQQVQWIVLAYLLAITTTIVSAGYLGDAIGRRRLLLAGIFLFTTASGLCSFTPTLLLLVAARAVQGLGAAIMMALTMAFVAETVSKEKTGTAMGLLGTMSAAGTALGPSLGGMLISDFGWQAIFLINVPLGIVAFLLCRRYLPADHHRHEVKWAGFDYTGMSLFVLALAAYAFAMTTGRGDFGVLNVALLLSAILATCLFVFVEKKVCSPLIRLDLLLDPVLGPGFATSALVSTVLMTTLVVGPFYLSRALGLETAPVGFIMTVGPVVVAISGFPAGRLVDRFGERIVVTAALAGIAAGSFLLYMTPMAWGASGYIIPIVIVTLSYAFFQTANNTLVMKDIGPDRRGVVSGMLNLSRNIGLITGASVMGAIFAWASGTKDISVAQPEAVAAGMQITFAVSGVLIALALAVLPTGPGRLKASADDPDMQQKQ